MKQLLAVELLHILTDLDARESVVQPSRRAAHGLQPKRPAKRKRRK